MKWMEKGWFGAAASVITGLLFAASLDLGPLGPVALVAPVPLLLYALRSPRAWPVALAAAVARAISMIGIVIVYGKDIPVAALIAWIATFALLYAAIVLLTRWIARRGAASAAVFAYPLCLVTAEWVWGTFAPHGSFASMGYSLVDVLPLLQAASIGGLAALTFLLALVPMTIAAGIARPDVAKRAALAGGVPVVAALVYGWVRLAQPYSAEASVALVAVDRQEGRAYAGEREDLEAAREFASQVREVAASHPDFIVLPEKQLGGGRIATASGGVLASVAAGAAPATVIAGFDEVMPGGARVNTAQIIKPGKPLRRYLKRRVIPGVELGYTTGVESFVDGDYGVAICKDMDFPAMIRDYGRRGVTLLLVPAWDFVADGRLHSRMAVVRGVENGFAIARAATAGRLTASDRYGRIVAEAVTSRAGPVVVVANLGLRGGGTVYSRIGDVFAWVCAGVAILLMAVRTLGVEKRALPTARDRDD